MEAITQMPKRNIPVVTICVLAVTAVVNALQVVSPRVLPALERAPGKLAAGQWWRLITPLFVHNRWWEVLFNFSAIALVGTFIERFFGGRNWLLLYFPAGIVGEVAGTFWKPVGAGNSVAGCGLLGALAAWLIWRQTAPGRFGGIFLLAGAAALTFFRDIHGPPIFVGAAIGATMLAAHLDLPGRKA
jgi:rhomboid protease GluP